MNKPNVLNVAKDIFSNITSIDDDLYKGELFIGSDKPAGVYYLDFSDNINKIDFKSYQENLLSKQYFSDPGSLQWNYYLLLFQDHFDQKKKQEIEKNDRYARKFIFTETEFEDFFKLESSKSSLNADIVLDWKKKLDTVDLQEVYSNDPISQSVERFYENKTEKLPDKKQKKVANVDAIKIEQIKQLVLTNKYRPFPVTQRTFDFKKVNLIKGINGVGKTSLFEAIEIILCGRTKRNPKKDELDEAIEVTFDGNRSEKYTPGQTEFYRKRDQLWYSNTYSRDNNLHISFNRYNFFNSDAAYSFANSSKEDEIKQALFNLVLGSEYNHIKERSEKFYGNIKTEYNRLDKTINESKQIINDADKVLKLSILTENLNTIKQKINENIIDLKVKIKIEDAEKNHAVVEELNNRIKSILEKIKEEPNYIKSLKEVNDRIKIYRDRQLLLETTAENYEKIVSNEILAQKTIDNVSKKLSLILECNKYFSDRKMFELEGLNAKYEKTMQQISRIKQIDETLEGIDINLYKLNISYVEYENEKNSQFKKNTEEKKTVDKILKDRLNKLGKAEKILKEIKLLGKEFLSINEHTAACPLCQSNFKEAELKSRIESISQDENLIEAEKTQMLYNKLSEINNFIEKLGLEINYINKVQVAYLILFPDEKIGPKALIDVVKSIQSEKSTIDKLKEEIKKIEEIKVLAQSFNTSELEFANLKNKMEESMPAIKFIYTSKDEFAKKAKELKKEVDDKKIDIDKLIEEKATLIFNLKKKTGIDSDSKVDIKTIRNSIIAESSKLTKAKNYFDKISELLTLQESDSVDELDLTSTVLFKNINSLKSELKNQFEVNAATKRKQDADKYIKDNKERFSRLKSAKDTLEALTSGDGSKQMEDFFNQNLAEIIDVFKTIHVPKEFVNIQFQENELYLTDEKGKKRKISEISTGQRSALALSIFISLNRKLKNGPDIIMFDDPVSYIDDFNALSFLDFLRYFVLKENKQIFFATASTRLASLFEKKFQFLDNEFKTFTLNREPVS